MLSRSSVLEVGSGAGRFTEVFLQSTSGYLHSIDYSNAVEANLIIMLSIVIAFPVTIFDL